MIKMFTQRLYSAVIMGTALVLQGCGGSVSTTPVAVPLSNLDTAFSVVGRSIYEATLPLGSLVPASTARKTAALLPNRLFLRGLNYSPQPNGVDISTAFSSNVLGDKNRATWSRDLEIIRAAGVNAIKVYNVPPPAFDGGDKINSFLDAAWNGGTNPIFVVITINIAARGAALLDSGAVSSLVGQYHDLASEYAKKPAILGMAIGNELAVPEFTSQPAWWTAYNQIASAARKGFGDGGDASKLIMSAEIDDISTVVAGEQNNVAIDVWGINSYRGRTFTNFTTAYGAATKKPILITEYGATAAYHPSIPTKYVYPTDGNKTLTAACTPNFIPGQNFPATSPTDIAELPATGDRSMAGLVDYVTNSTTLIHDSFMSDQVLSGGFYFEWSDEWYKVGTVTGVVTGTQHLGSVPGWNGAFPGCSNDESWYGLNSTVPGSPDVLTPRPSLTAISQVWKSEI
jgi:hypothetical protein